MSGSLQPFALSMVLVLLIYMVIHSVQELNSNKTCLIVIPSSNAKQQNRNELQGFLFVREHLSYACSATLSQNLLACLLKFNCRPASDTQDVYLYTGKKRCYIFGTKELPCNTCSTHALCRKASSTWRGEPYLGINFQEVLMFDGKWTWSGWWTYIS